jgi:AcrR family transcriptional regulator
VTKGALYFHFANKDDLVVAVVDHVGQVLGELAAQVSGGCANPAQVLINLTHALGVVLAEDPYVRAGFRLAREAGGRGSPFRDSYLIWRAAVSRAAVEAHRQGALAPTVTADSVADTALMLSVGLEAALAANLTEEGFTGSLGGAWRLLLPGAVAPTSVHELLPDGGVPQDD